MVLNTLEEAILRTVLYADVFDFPMTPREIAHFLIAETPASLAQVENALKTSFALQSALCINQGYVYCVGREQILDIRLSREQASEHLWNDAIRYGTWLSYLPFVRMVALTGALAMRNASTQDDDLDYVLVTVPQRVWIARAFAVVMVRIVKLFGDVICPNYVLAETALAQERQDLYMAHEIVQMVPIFGGELYEQMRAENAWVVDHLPNAHNAFYDARHDNVNRVGSAVKSVVEWIFSGRLGDRFEQWEHQRKRRRFSQKLEKPHNAAILDDSKVKGHFEDHGHPVLKKYYARLEQHKLDVQSLPLAGD